MQFNWLEILEEVLKVIVFPIVGAAALYLITWLRVKKLEVLQKTKDETAKKYLEMLDTTIADCVLATNQTYVEILKKEGTFDADAQKKAFQLTFDAVMSVLTDDAQKYLGEAVKDLGAYIKTKIEAQVSLTKH